MSGESYDNHPYNVNFERKWAKEGLKADNAGKQDEKGVLADELIREIFIDQRIIEEKMDVCNLQTLLEVLKRKYVF